MAVGIGSMMQIGKSALFGSQAALQVVGQNISNVHTEGYSRQEVRFEAYPSLDYYPGQMGMGVNAAEVIRHFDKFVERQFLQKNSDAMRWSAMATQMTSLESVFNESYGFGIGSLLSSFFAGWEKLSQFPDDQAVRQALMSSTQTLTESIRSANSSITKAVERAESEVIADVDKANQLMKSIAALNIDINTHWVKGKNNPNGLLDERDQLVRELGTLIDIDVQDLGGGEYRINTKAGHTLVDGGNTFELAYSGPTTFYNRQIGSTFDGDIGFNGTDGHEYTVEFVSGGAVGTAQFKVSLDGGRSWVTDETGQPKIFTSEDKDKPVKIKDLEIYFDPGSGNPLMEGDRFTIVPKNALYWIEPTMGPMVITPQQLTSGADNQTRVTGGSIGGNLMFISYQAEEIRDQLDEFTKNFIWEVNRIHSQGSGSQHLNSVFGDYAVRDSSYALNSPYIGMPWGDRLQAGSFSIALYDTITGEPLLLDPGMQSSLDINFDPSMSLDDLVAAMQSTVISGQDSQGNTYAGVTLDTFLDIKVVDGRLSITGKSVNGQAFEFGFGNDTTGVLAALGVNTFFRGDNAANIQTTDAVTQNLNFINGGRINGGAESNSGDNITAREIAALVEKTLTFTDWTGKKTEQNILSHYATIVSSVGSKASNNSFQASAYLTQAMQLSDTQDAIAGVNLDEEMTSLIKFQASYKAAAKLITTADEMFQTVLGMKN